MRRLAPLVSLGLAACSVEKAVMTPEPGGDLALEMKLITLQPGEDQAYCQYFPPDGKARRLRRFGVALGDGVHHLWIYRIDTRVGAPPTVLGVAPCAHLEMPPGFDGLMPGGPTPLSEVTLPDGVMMKVEPYHGFYLSAHAINPSRDTSMVTGARWDAKVADAAPGQAQAAMLVYSIFDLNVPTGMSTQTRSCKAPFDLQLVMATGHMHRHGRTFDASVAGKAIHHDDSWEMPRYSLFPGAGFAVKANDPITFSCAYDNDTGMPLLYGNSTATDEMCLLMGVFYPSMDSNTELTCNRL